MARKYPSGPWRGYFTYAGETSPNPMRVSLTFDGDRVQGQGDDEVGRFLIAGEYDAELERCAWTKGYLGKHGVEYRAECHDSGMVGQWRLRGSKGAFALWPGESETAPADLETLVPHVPGLSRKVKRALLILLILALGAATIFLQLNSGSR